MNFERLYRLILALINIAGYIRYVEYYIFHHNYFKVVKKNVALINNKNKDKILYVCALGPSLKNVKLNKLNGDTIVVNRFFKIGEKHPDFIPTYYLIVDSRFTAPDHREDFNNCMGMYLGKGTKYILNSKCASIAPLEIDQTDIYYISTFRGDFNSSKKLDISNVMPSVGNVASAAIACGISMGYKKIVLLGCDFNSFASPVTIHCYDDKNKERQYRLYYELFRYSLASYTHEEIAAYAKKNGVSIVNSTKGSLIDSYPIEIDDSLYE